MGQGPGLRARHLPRGSQPLVSAQISLPLNHPGREVMLLVDKTSNDHRLGHDEEDGERADPHDQFLQLVGLGAVLLHHSSDLDEAEQAEDKEDAAEAKIGGQWGEDEQPHSVHVPEADKADSGQDVTLDTLEDENDDGGYGWLAPGYKVKPLTLNINGLLAPLEGGREEPAEGEDHPPHRGGHEEEVDDHEEQGAAPILIEKTINNLIIYFSK